MRPTAIVLVLLALAGPAFAQDPASARSVEDCESLPGVEAYNRCLARFGPPATSVGPGTARPPRGADPEAEPSPAAPAASRPGPRRPSVQAASRRGSTVRRAGGGRQSASFTVVTGRGRPARSAPPPRRRR